MKKTRTWLNAATSVLVLLACAGCATLGFGTKMDPTAHKNIGILVVRVGNTFPVAPLHHVELDTNFDDRQPSAYKNVLIETDERLTEIFTNYPNYPDSRPGRQVNYYDNISRELEKEIYDFFSLRGYGTTAVHGILDGAEPHYSNLTVRQIVAMLQGTVDALLVLEYMDRADLDATVDNERTVVEGFAGAMYTYTMFDVDSGDVLFSYAPFSGFFLPAAIISSVEYQSDEYIQNKVTVKQETDGYISRTSISHALSKQDMVKLVATSIINGLDIKSSKKYSGFDSSFYELKGLVDFVPSGR